METTFNFVESKIAFIREFMNSTRPASELEAFIKAFDTCNIERIESVVKEDISIPEFTPLPTSVCDTPVVRRGRKKKEALPVIHDGNRPNVHPRAKMVRVQFMGRVSYYGSITAAASALHVTIAQVKYALKHNKTINGQEVALQDANAVVKNFSKA